MRRGRIRANSLYPGNKGEKGIRDITLIWSLSGAINRSGGHRTEAGWGGECTALIRSAERSADWASGAAHWAFAYMRLQ